MVQPAEKKATYDDLYNIPENMIGEIIDGELITTPRPAARHSYTASVLGFELGPPFQIGRNGPGGWVILHKIEIMMGENLLVPDLTGWRRERFPGLPKENWISVPPDWVCEILSPSTVRVDKIRKMPVYARHEVPYVWLIDPVSKTLDVFKLESGKWVWQCAFVENDKVRAEPLHEVEIELGNLWIE
ncbi:MAG: Uma2 family endonuclease [Syntrophobacteraceae bacterium]